MAMKLEAMVLAESVDIREGREWVTITCMERNAQPLLQMFDYGLREDEKIHKGKLVGKAVSLQVTTIRSIFGGRPQMTGHLELTK